MYEEGDSRLRGLEETVPGLSEALYEVEAFIRQTTAQQTETAAQSAEQRGDLKEYQETANRQLAEQQKLDKLQAELDALPKDKRKTDRVRFLRDELIKTKNRLQICQSIQTRLETDSPLTYLIHRKINPQLAEVPQKPIAEKIKYDTIVAEFKVAGLIPPNAIVHIPPMAVDTTTLSFDDAHINGERGHNVTREQALNWIREAKISVNVWNGRFERYYSESGASYADFANNSVRTAYSAEEFDEKTQKRMEVLKENGY